MTLAQFLAGCVGTVMAATLAAPEPAPPAPALWRGVEMSVAHSRAQSCFPSMMMPMGPALNAYDMAPAARQQIIAAFLLGEIDAAQFRRLAVANGMRFARIKCLIAAMEVEA